MPYSRSLSVAVIAVAFGLAGCEQPAATDLTLKAGTYRIVAKQGSRAVWHDYFLVPEKQARTVLKVALPVFQDRMAPSDGSSSWQTSDRPCKTSKATVTGGTFTATGTCRIVSKGKTTKFEYQGTAYGDSFKINVTRSGFGTKTEGTPDDIVITGTFEKS
ncbi:MAG: hypothetical protein HOP13_20685 [Alphaproteobacteria bacterium]|nr:hypothetical protein [Alphaproteobacteria bacterium]